jgi:hypothetical protein
MSRLQRLQPVPDPIAVAELCRAFRPVVLMTPRGT